MLSKISQSEKSKDHIISLICGTETHIHRQQYDGYQRECEWRVKEVKYMVMEDDLTLGGGHTVQYADHVAWMCTWNVYDLINQHHSNKFNKMQNYKRAQTSTLCKITVRK